MSKMPASCLPGVKIIDLRVFSDDRGFFMESYNQQMLAEHHQIQQPFVQDNFSHSKQHVIRGLHYQITQPQGKLVRVLNGTVYDVMVDLRKSSPTFGQWMGILLQAQDFKAVWIPPGFAHGFLVLSAQADFFYKTTDFYAPAAERCLVWNDPKLAIQWPITKQPLLSAKDAQGHFFEEIDTFL